MNTKPPKMATDLALRNEESNQIAHRESESLRHYLQVDLPEPDRPVSQIHLGF